MTHVGLRQFWPFVTWSVTHVGLSINWTQFAWMRLYRLNCYCLLCILWHSWLNGKMGNETVCVDLGSADYQAAVRETKALFPDGLCCDANPHLSSEQVPPALLLSKCSVRRHYFQVSFSIPFLSFCLTLCGRLSSQQDSFWMSVIREMWWVQMWWHCGMGRMNVFAVSFAPCGLMNTSSVLSCWDATSNSSC